LRLPNALSAAANTEGAAPHPVASPSQQGSTRRSSYRQRAMAIGGGPARQTNAVSSRKQRSGAEPFRDSSRCRSLLRARPPMRCWLKRSARH